MGLQAMPAGGREVGSLPLALMATHEQVHAPQENNDLSFRLTKLCSLVMFAIINCC